MKKTLRFFSSLILTLPIASQTFACSPPSLGEIWIITDGGDIHDHAFNEQVLDGTIQFANNFNSHISQISQLPEPGFSYWKTHKLKIKTIISENGAYSTLQNNYSIAGFAGAKTIVCAGFNHLSALTNQIQATYKKLGVRFILVDARVNNPINVAALNYSSNQSGFLAGLAGAIWLMANHEKYDANGLKMSSFGGLPADTVVNYMFGYYWGVYYFNHYKSTDSHILELVNDLRKTENKSPMSQDDLNNKTITFDKLKNSFTGDFNSGSPASQAICYQLINENKDAVVLPVAGAQTTDAISAILKSSVNSQAKLIGVDVNQAVQYPSAKNLFITSALKDIKNSVANELWTSLNLNYKNQNVTYDSNAAYDFSHSLNPIAGGISNDASISAIYKNLLQYYQNKLVNVSAAFKKLDDYLSKVSAADKWSVAWEKYIDQNVTTYMPNFN